MIDQVSGRTDPLLQFDIRHRNRLREKIPEKAVHDACERGNIDTRTRARKLREKLKHGSYARGRPGVNLTLFAREVGVG